MEKSIVLLMAKTRVSRQKMSGKTTRLPIVVEKDEDGFYVVECPILSGCYSQGKSLDEALRNIEEVIDLLSEEKEMRDMLWDYAPGQLSFHTITVKL